jgi:hypothetical protein
MTTNSSMSVFEQPSRRNSLDKRFDPIHGSKAVDRLYEIVEQARKNDGKRGYGKADGNIKHHIEAITADLYATWSSDTELYIGYSRDERAFESEGAYGDKLSYTAFIDIIAVFEQHKPRLIENHIQSKGFGGKPSSRMRATQALADIVEGEGVNWASIVFDPSAEVLVLKSKKDKKTKTTTVLSFNDADHNQIPNMRANIEVINQKLARTFLNLNVTDDEMTEINRKVRQDPENEAVDFTKRHLRRVFNNGNWNDGGRFYGGWWIGLPSKKYDYRQHIEIEGKLTDEWDYSSIHPTILYAQEGEPAPEDSYDIPGWDKKYRDLIKKAFNQLLNSAKATRPKGKWRTLAPDTDPDPLPSGWKELETYERVPFQRDEFKRLTNKDYDDLIRDIIEHHQPIQHHFFTKAWSWLQKMDADIAERVMVDMFGRDMVVLPVHDSFIVRRGFEGYLKGAMKRVFQEVVGVEPKMKSDAQVLRRKKLKEIGGNGIISGRAAMKISMVSREPYRSHGLRRQQWQQVWGLEGWD